MSSHRLELEAKGVSVAFHVFFSNSVGKLAKREDETPVLACNFMYLDGESYAKEYKLNLSYIAPPEIKLRRTRERSGIMKREKMK